MVVILLELDELELEVIFSFGDQCYQSFLIEDEVLEQVLCVVEFQAVQSLSDSLEKSVAGNIIFELKEQLIQEPASSEQSVLHRIDEELLDLQRDKSDVCFTSI